MKKSPALEIDVVTIFPDFFTSPLEESLIRKARERGLVKIRLQNLRDFTHDRHKTVDDRPFGGGPGMVMKPEPIFECVESLKGRGKSGKPWVVLLDPKGEQLTPALAEKLAGRKKLVLIAGHYEGVDHRVYEQLADQAVSVGSFVTMGGEAPALCLIEAVMRFVPGVLGNQDSLKDESFTDGGLEYPQYTRPRNYRGWEVPGVLISGDHPKVAKWRRENARGLTRKRNKK